MNASTSWGAKERMRTKYRSITMFVFPLRHNLQVSCALHHLTDFLPLCIDDTLSIKPVHNFVWILEVLESDIYTMQ